MAVQGESSETGAWRRAIPETVASFLEGVAREVELLPLPGDASDRRYLRVRVGAQGGPGPGSFVLMKLARPWVPEPHRAEIPFVNVARHLGEKGIPVPAVLVDASRQGAVLLEDVGDCTLEAHLRQSSPQERRRCYREAVEILVRMQTEASRASRLPCVALSYAFDGQTFFRELDFFREFALEGLWRRRMTPAAQRELRVQFWDLSQRVASLPQVFTHRDYHARNLMVQDGRLRVLDFQDARLGPLTYDLASLLRDSYVHLEEDEEEQAVVHYLESAESAGLFRPGGGDAFRQDYLRTAVQRNLKAIGTFAYQCVGKGVDRYLASIPNTLDSIRRSLNKESEFSRLRDLLGEWIETL